MNAEQKGRLRRRTKELRAALAERQDALRERLDTVPAVRRARARRRRQRLLGLLLLLSLLLLLRCDCENPPEPVAPPPATQPAPEAPPKKPVVKAAPATKPRLRDQADTRRRATYEPEARPQPSWIDDFRLQVAARGPRLAKCFDGSERPGALRWTASVNAGSGVVSDHVLEPLGASGGLSSEQRDCAVGVLTSPAYRLRGDAAQALPERVSIAVEF